MGSASSSGGSRACTRTWAADIRGRERGLATLTLRWMIDRVTSACKLELDPRVLESAPPSASDCTSRSRSGIGSWKPANRTIDGGLGHHGVRDGDRITAEVIDESIGQWRAKYAQAPMPVVKKIYKPKNVLEYEARIATQAQTPPVQPPDYPSDLREARQSPER